MSQFIREAPPTTAEQIDVVLGTQGKGDALLEQFGDFATLLANLDCSLLTPTQRRKLGALGRLYLTQEERPEPPGIHSPLDVFHLMFSRLAFASQEYLYVLPLNIRNKLVGEPVEVYHGSLNQVQVRVAEVFKPAIVRNAAAIVVAHNHPSGLVEPGPDDVALTRSLIQAGQLLNIEVLDHIVLSNGQFYSLKENGLAF